ncbi:hypothetical protein C8R46DRAFT_650618 [Mycena filopes]|nr:hypothetical protein C8R46DRAFT_650618 [Mycena filopes]
MDTETPAGSEFSADSNMDKPEVTSASGPFFPGSHHFTIAGGTFNSITAPDVPSDIRMIPLGDIDLQQELLVHETPADDDSGLISLQPRECVRRVYSAKVLVPKVDMTVAMYEGDTAEEVSSLFFSPSRDELYANVPEMPSRRCDLHEVPSPPYN